MSAASIALSIGAAQAVFTSPVVAAGQTAEKEKCYGVSLKGKNACKAGADTSLFDAALELACTPPTLLTDRRLRHRCAVSPAPFFEKTV